MLHPVHTICVCGAGTMGSGIAQVAAQNGFQTILFDLNPSVLQKAEASVHHNLSALCDKQKITAVEKGAILQRMRFVASVELCIAGLVIEAIVENAEAKTALFNRLAAINHEDTILATNTSSLSVSDIARGVANPSRVAGMHFFNPAPVMKLVEVVQGEHTSEATTAALYAWAKQLGKTPIVCKDVPGFIVNRVARHYYLEALKLAEENLAGIETIDTLLEASGFKTGPFRLMDLIGNDINLEVTRSLYQAFGRPLRFRPSPLQEEKVLQGELGRKTGKGYYSYQ